MPALSWTYVIVGVLVGFCTVGMPAITAGVRDILCYVCMYISVKIARTRTNRAYVGAGGMGMYEMWREWPDVRNNNKCFVHVLGDIYTHVH